MARTTFEVRIIGEVLRRDVVKSYTDRREAEREYRRLARARAHVQLSYRLVKVNRRAA
jgi:hypothetical protein